MFRQIDSRHYKRIDYRRNRQGRFTNKFSGKTVLATIMLISLFGYVGYVKVDNALANRQAPKEIVAPIPEGDIVGSVSVTPKLSPSQIEEYIATDIQKDKKYEENIKAQQQFNEAMTSKVSGLENAVTSLSDATTSVVSILQDILGGTK